MDVKSLYLNIPQDLGIEMVLNRTHPTRLPRPHVNREKEMLRDLLMTTVKDNIFSFGDSMYRQLKGVAMGTKCAPPFSNLFMAAFEEEALLSWKRERSDRTSPTLWLRYLDDIFIIWQGKETDLLFLLEHLNWRLPTIKLSLEMSTTSIDFRSNNLQGPQIRQPRYSGHQTLCKANSVVPVPPL